MCGAGVGGFIESKVLSAGVMLLAPQVKETAVTKSDIPGGIDSQVSSGLVDPFGRTFELGEVPDGRFIHHAVAGAISPFGAPFFIAEGGHEAQGEKELGERFAVGDFGFGFDAVLMGVFARAGVGEAFVSQEAAARIVANSEDLGSRAHGAAWCVV